MNENEKINIVFAEDSPVQGVVLKRLLVEQGYTVHWGRNGKEGLDLVNKIRPSLVISDVEMPDMNGFQLCAQIKQNIQLKHIPVIICSSLSNPEDILTGIEVGADGYVTKPYDKKFLMYRVKALLENPIRVKDESKVDVLELNYANKKFNIKADGYHILNMLLSTYENTVKQYNDLFNAQLELKKLNQKLDLSYKESERLLVNILPVKIADQLKKFGAVQPVSFSSATVLFTDIKGFTKMSENLSAKELTVHLDISFNIFDNIIDKYNLEKIKTIGDAYMCAGGVPEPSNTHVVDTILAGLEIQKIAKSMFPDTTEQPNFWNIRLGISTGPVVAGVIGSKKFTYDLWGDTVNTASRMESSGEPGKVNISSFTWETAKYFFSTTYRGKLPAKNKGDIDMYFVDSILPELSIKGEGLEPNSDFYVLYEKLKTGELFKDEITENFETSSQEN
jgi:class 3 adenylate cyclase/DNA-binding NarL/FixJ family response regulator